MIDSNKRIADGTTSNIFIVKNGILKTPALTEFVLPGVTRQVVLELAASLNISHEEQDLIVDDVYRADEVFLTNTRIEILPVQQADRQVIGTGTPGPVTRQLRALFLKTFGVSSQK
jgi:branched-subunit amino acid aminotransferase/4-amino-4-deoxychorismate lyase